MKHQILRIFQSRLWLWFPVLFAVFLGLSYPFLMITAFSPPQNQKPFWLVVGHIIFLFGDKLWFWPFLVCIALIFLHFASKRDLPGGIVENSPDQLLRKIPAKLWRPLPSIGFLIIYDHGIMLKGLLLLALPKVDIGIFLISTILLSTKPRENAPPLKYWAGPICGLFGLYLAWLMGIESPEKFSTTKTAMQHVTWALSLHIGTIIYIILHYLNRKDFKPYLSE